MVPDGWKSRPFGDIVRLSKNKYDPKKSSECLPCIELEHLAQETGQVLGSVPAANLGSIKNRFNAGDVIFGKLRPYLRKYACPNFYGVCSSEIWVFSPTKEILNPYLYQVVQSEAFITEANKSAGSKMPRADWGVVSEMMISTPPLPEQRKIAQILSTWDKAIATTEKLIAASKLQKKSLMQQLLTGKKRLIDPETGKAFEGKWVEREIGYLLKEVKRPVKWDDNADYRLLSVKRRSEGIVLREVLKGHKILTKKMNLAKQGDFLISKMQIVHGASGLVTSDFDNCHISGSYLALVPRNPEHMDIDFFSWLSKQKKMSHQAFLCSYGVHIEKMTFNFKLYLKEKVLIPPRTSEQQKIAHVLTAADKEIELLEAKLTHLKQEKKALMQQLLTGKRRVSLSS